MNKNESEDQLVQHKDGKVDVETLTFEYRRSLTDGHALERIQSADDVRYARWNSQTSDFKKHASALSEGTQPFPFEGAADNRIRLADETINQLVATMMNGFQKSQLKVGATESSDTEAAASMNTLMRWLIGTKLYHELRREAELMAQYSMQYGWSAMFVGWEQQNQLMPMKITLEQIVEMSQQDPAFADFPKLILDPAQESVVVDMLITQVDDLKRRPAKKIVRELRETGESSIPIDYIVANKPLLVACRPYDEISFPPETTTLQKARVIFRKQYMSEVELRSMINDDDWNEAWVEEALKTTGRSSDFSDITTSVSALSADAIDRRDNLVEVVWAYTKQLNDQGVPAIYTTVFAPMIQRDALGKALFAKHEMLDYNHCRYPFVEFKREVIKRRVVESRPITEVIGSYQTFLKNQIDSIMDRTSFETLPAIEVNKRLGLINKVGPAVMLPVTKSGDYSFMKPPAGVATTAFETISFIERSVAKYFGLPHPDVSPQVTMMTQQSMMNNWLTVWTEIYQMMFQLTLQYLDDEDLMKITGAQVPINRDKEMPDFVLKFDVSDLDQDYVLKKMEIIAQQLVPLDVGGSIERNKLIEKLVRSISPDFADDILTDQSSASQKMYNEVKSEMGGMMLGFEPNYTENDPTAGTKLKYAKELGEKNPKVKEAAEKDQLFGQLIQNYIQNLEMSVTQEQNKTIGKIGVQPVT